MPTLLIRTLITLFCLLSAYAVNSQSNTATVDSNQRVNTLNTGTFQQSSIGFSMMGNSDVLSSLLKDKNEMAIYMRCYISQRYNSDRVALARIKEFNRLYKPYIEQASETFQIPYALSACVLLRETFLDNNAVSPTGARTIAQFTSSTYDTLKVHINETRRLESDYQELLSLQNDPNFDLFNSRSDNFFVKCNQHASEQGFWPTQVSRSEREKSRKICSGQLLNHSINRPLVAELREFVQQSAQSMDEETYNSYFDTPRNQGGPAGNDFLPPSSFATLKRKPMWLMALNMFYLKRMAVEADIRFNPSGFRSGQDYLGYLTVVGGSYNRGPRALNRAVGRSEGSIRQWCQSLSSSTETRNYMLSLKRCMAKGTNFAMTGMRQSQACNEQPEGVHNITDPCDTLLVPGDGRVYDMTQPGEPAIEDSTR